MEAEKQNYKPLKNNGQAWVGKPWKHQWDPETLRPKIADSSQDLIFRSAVKKMGGEERKIFKDSRQTQLSFAHPSDIKEMEGADIRIHRRR